jgi:hypothetical protein
VLKRQDYLRGIEPNPSLREFPTVLQMCENLPTAHKFGDKVYSFGCAEGKFKLDHERVAYILHDPLLRLRMLQLILLDDVLFADLLHSVVATGVYLLNKTDFPKSTTTKDFADLETVGAKIYVRLGCVDSSIPVSIWIFHLFLTRAIANT